MGSFASISRMGLLGLAVTVSACGGKDGGGRDGGTMTGADAGPIAASDDHCPGEVQIAFDTTVRGETGSGWNAEIRDWFDNSNVACDPFGTDYPPPYQVYALEIPPHSDWDIVVQPDAGVDVSLVSWMTGLSFPACEPLAGYPVITCDVSNFEAAGGEEYTWVNAITNPYKIVILVGTPPGGTAGGFDLRVVNHRR